MMTNGYKIHVAVDLDDVVVAFVDGVRAAVRAEYGVEPPEFTDFKLGQFLDPIIGKPWFTWMQERDWIWKTFPAVEGAIGTLEKLRDFGCYLEAVTHKPRWAEATTWQWLGRWRPPFHRVTIVDPARSKADYTNADILVDDKIENVRDFCEAGRLALLFTRPHNRRESLPEGAVRVDSWGEVYSYISALENV